MAQDQNRRLKPSNLVDDKKSLDAMDDMANYAPSNDDFTKIKLDAAWTAMDNARKLETQKEAVAIAARDAANAAEWASHNLILGAKTQVVAQYGENSDEVQAVGLKKKSERKKPTRKSKVTPPA